MFLMISRPIRQLMSHLSYSWYLVSCNDFIQIEYINNHYSNWQNVSLMYKYNLQWVYLLGNQIYIPMIHLFNLVSPNHFISQKQSIHKNDRCETYNI